MTKQTLLFGIAGLVIGALASVALGGQTFGGVYTQVTNEFYQGLKAGSSNQFQVEADGDLVTSEDITLTKSTFCINFYATSTATLNRMVASSTATIEGTDGVMVMQYGVCP